MEFYRILGIFSVICLIFYCGYFWGGKHSAHMDDRIDRKVEKPELLLNLKNSIYCRLQPSPISGIGVFAIRDIPNGINPFEIAGQTCQADQVIFISKDELQDLPNEIQQTIPHFFAKKPNDQYYPIISGGLNAINISFYINHSSHPNITLVTVPGCDYYQFITKNKIRTGEELTFDYSQWLGNEILKTF